MMQLALLAFMGSGGEKSRSQPVKAWWSGKYVLRIKASGEIVHARLLDDNDLSDCHSMFSDDGDGEARIICYTPPQRCSVAVTVRPTNSNFSRRYRIEVPNPFRRN